MSTNTMVDEDYSDLILPSGKEDLTFLGLNVGDYKIDDVLGEGLFARVYHGRAQSGSRKAFKVANPSGRSSIASERDNTQALRQITGGYLHAHPDTNDLLEIEAKRLKDNAHPNLVQLDSFCALALPYYQMEYLEGVTLRQMMQAGQVPLRVFLDIARAMNQLLRDTSFSYHGDLKPENIIITEGGGIKFIDPGYFGELRDENGKPFTALITTPIYYPYMKPDDVYALGLIMWEAAFGQNPLAQKTSIDEMSCQHVHEDLHQHVHRLEMVGNYNLSALLAIDDPQVSRPDMPPETRAFLLKALRLRGGATLGFDSGFQSMAQIAGALIALIEKGIEHF